MMLWSKRYPEHELAERLSKLINKGFGYRSLARRMVLRHFDSRHDYTPRTLHQMMLACLMAGDYESALILRETALRTRVGGGIDIDTKSAVFRDMANYCAKQRDFVMANWEMGDAQEFERFLSPESAAANRIVVARIAALNEDYRQSRIELARAKGYLMRMTTPNPQFLWNVAWNELLVEVIRKPTSASMRVPYDTYVSTDPSPARRFFGAILVSKLPRELRSQMARRLLSH